MPNQPSADDHSDGEPRPGTKPTKAILWIAGGLTVAIAVVIALWAFERPDGRQSDHDSNGEDTSGQEIRGTLDDWLTAICAPGKFYDGTTFNGATGGGSCPIGNPDYPNDLVYVTQYDSNFKMNNDLAAYQMQYYASSINDQGQINVFAVRSARGRSALLPLSQFGFEIYAVQRR
ncbi:hypothetical protein [Antrihabitans spumae]|uniref:Uncharacterized protein n=1 Tax=Antrihabitans spumae TaxID=3373370 RepID=A0ABW7K5W2_9NOCA